MRQFILFTAAVLAGLSPASAASLSEVVGTVLGRNPAIRGARSGVREAESALKGAYAMSLPRVSARASMMRSDNALFAFGSRLDHRNVAQRDFLVDGLNRPGYRTNIKSALEIGVPLFTGFGLHTRRKVGRLAVDGAKSRAEGAEQAKRFEAVESHLTVLLAEARIRMLDERVVSAEAMAEDARKLKKKGVVLGSDFFAAEAILGKLKVRRTHARHGLAAARARLAVLAGGELTPGGSLTSRGYDAPAGDALLARALGDRRDLRTARLRTSMAEAGRKHASLSILPTVEAFAAVETATYDFDENPASRFLGVRAVLPFGDPGYLPRRARAAARVEASRATAKDYEERVRVEVARAREAFEGAAAGLPTVEWTLEQARKSLELFRPLYRQGRQSVMEVLRAEDALAQAQDAHLTSMFHLHAGYARLMLATGGLDDAVVKEIEERLEAGR